ncbi:hypothetical protein F2Q69_00057458 [Brassica cretica]|uniref:Uncharacterized protein n=1 Tax=Brassica cretica TaxID=69181 RepID=A0A8S9MXJ4_BRACR|nr:hypothetical protein F2Q69_00057458 [Brassica cretica]
MDGHKYKTHATNQENECVGFTFCNISEEEDDRGRTEDDRGRIYLRRWGLMGALLRRLRKHGHRGEEQE